MAKEVEGGASFDYELRGRVEAASKELNVVGNCPRTVAILNGDFMDSIGVKNQHAAVRVHGVFAEQAGMVELNLEPHGLQ